MKHCSRVTRSTDQYVFKTDIVHKDIHAKSPFYCGVSLWNSVPIECQNLLDRRTFKINIKKQLEIY